MNAEELLQNIEGQRPDLRFENINVEEDDEDLPDTIKESDRLSAI
jgi:hypothetical protein